MKKKENSTLNYTLSSSSFPFFWVVKTEATLLFLYCLLITVKRNWAESQNKTPGGILKIKAEITVSCHDLGLMSRPGFSLSALVQLRTKYSLVATSFLAASLTSGCDLFGSIFFKN